MTPVSVQQAEHPVPERKTALTPAACYLGAALLLLIFVLALYSRLLFTNRVLANGDILHYFYPYRDYAAAALREGRIPFWNPFIFMGAPFLANPQAAVLYPLHWPLSWLAVTKQIYWSAALHTWLLGLGGYALMRRWQYGFTPALATGLILTGSGFVGGLLGHINQLNGVAWLPWIILTLEQGWPRGNNRTEIGGDTVPWFHVAMAAPLLGGLVALMLLAGHTQTVYINLFGAGVWTIWPLISFDTLRRPRTALRGVLPMLGIYAGGVLLGVLLAAPQILPTLELSNLGLRSGGLGYGEASSFSLKPLQLPWTLLPSYGLADLSVVFETLGYTEFVAYIGLLGLFLALAGIWQGRGRAHTFGLLFAMLGLFLATGRWNPFYFLLYKLVPGFDLFRAPARWMMLYTLGMAVLAGIGVGTLWPRLQRRLPAPAVTVLLLTVLSIELLLAARALPHTQTTAPEAVYGLRTAPAHILTDPARTLHPAAAGRFLSMSTITFDPGDMADYRRVFVEGDDATLTERAFEQLVIAQKSQEILAPNLPLLWRVPAVDGFDGGVLPLQRYIRGLTLFIPEDELVPDGRLREQITEMPPADLLALFNVEYVITDKVRDLWYDGIYYDRQIGARLTQEAPAVEIDAPTPFDATHLAVVGYVDGPPPVLTPLLDANLPAAALSLEDEAGNLQTWTLTAGGAPGVQFADGQLDSPMAQSAGAEVAFRDVEGGRQEYVARFALADPMTPRKLTVLRQADGPDVFIQAVTLIDERTGMFTPLLPSDRGRFSLVHSGDVKIYANREAAPRVRLVHDWQPVATEAEALAYLQAEGGAVLEKPVVEGSLPPEMTPQPDIPAGVAEMMDYAPERLEIRTVSDSPGVLVVADSYYPGWQATIDGEAAPLLAANFLFRAVPVPAGEHTVVMEYHARGWRQGLGWSALGAGLALGIFILGRGFAQRRRR